MDPSSELPLVDNFFDSFIESPSCTEPSFTICDPLPGSGLHCSIYIFFCHFNLPASHLWPKLPNWPLKERSSLSLWISFRNSSIGDHCWDIACDIQSLIWLDRGLSGWPVRLKWIWCLYEKGNNSTDHYIFKSSINDWILLSKLPKTRSLQILFKVWSLGFGIKWDNLDMRQS